MTGRVILHESPTKELALWIIKHVLEPIPRAHVSALYQRDPCITLDARPVFLLVEPTCIEPCRPAGILWVGGLNPRHEVVGWERAGVRRRCDHAHPHCQAIDPVRFALRGRQGSECLAEGGIAADDQRFGPCLQLLRLERGRRCAQHRAHRFKAASAELPTEEATDVGLAIVEADFHKVGEIGRHDLRRARRAVALQGSKVDVTAREQRLPGKFV